MEALTPFGVAILHAPNAALQRMSNHAHCHSGVDVESALRVEGNV